MVQLVTPAAMKLMAKQRSNRTFTVTVDWRDQVYAELHEWVLARMPNEVQRALVLSTECAEDKNGSSDACPPETKVRLRYDGSREQTIEVDGHKVLVRVERETLGRDESWSVGHAEKIIFTAKSRDGRDTIIDTVAQIAAERKGRADSASLYLPSRWGGGWERRGDVPPRSLDSVILKSGQMEKLLADLTAFFDSEEEYGRYGQPWHRGYLFHGAPGTGKTTIARALASHFGMATYYLPLGDVQKDQDLMQLVGDIRPRSLLLLEDVDSFHAATDRSDAKQKASVAAMLGALDGVWTPHGLITVMTTNHRDRLDPALIRAGRVDVDEEFTALDTDQAGRLARYLGKDVDPGRFDGASPSEMIRELREASPCDPQEKTAKREVSC